MSKLVAVSQDDIDKAYNNFRLMFFPHESGVGHHLWAFIGMKKAPSFDRSPIWRMPEENAKFIRMLAGPHHKALAKAMIANGHQYEVPING